MKSIKYLLIASVLLLSCEETVSPPEIENIEDLLVVNSILNPTDSIYYVEVTWSNPSFGLLPDFEDEFVTNAIVTISDGSRQEAFVYETQQRRYELDAERFPIEPGATYQLTVSANGQEAFATASTKTGVPLVESFEFRNSRDLSISWKDLEGSEDFYTVTAFLKREEQDFTNLIPYFFESGFVSDRNRDGSILQDTGEGFESPRSMDTLLVTLYSYNELYVDYFEILENYIGDDPFSEPVQLPSNIQGGLGIFAIVQQSDFKMRAR